MKTEGLSLLATNQTKWFSQERISSLIIEANNLNMVSEWTLQFHLELKQEII